MANILYLSSHSILEYDEIKLFQELGHTVYSLHGAYSHGQGDGKRPSLPMNAPTHLHDVAMQCSRENIHPEIIAWADIIFCMHRVDWLNDNWDKMEGKKVVLRTIGQNTDSNERDIAPLRSKGLRIVRMSPTEETIVNYQGKDALIRFYKDPDEFFGYTGSVNRVVNVSQAMYGNDTVHSRGDHMNIEVFKKVMEGFDWKIYGSDNEGAGDHFGGQLSYDDMKNMFKFNGVYFYVGTQPSPYSLAFIEPFMTGIPIVSIGSNLATSVYPQQKTWEIPSIIENGVSGYVSDNIVDLRNAIMKLLNDKEHAMTISRNAVVRAKQFFGKDTIKNQWAEFFNAL